ncbi:MAG: GDP-mannose 4,6 dehydratase [Candidatus Kerfeldbacteria bacterium CG08_land_8_20_14_0_20_42_7]|uniref:GDP-mannose 4,6 dehydratase n=1 Tax=Candidatus Kerfeldbacteria bacterium CG08_land_8_20_14_0_20_42_7 TaxID=2014245 RepID=A0A2H0YVF0_9BACT|nr:MAG: GDP-mannose 4,6 dehydratase [Candidatus Kerfeldbacteria bacterium CG08_land_8_20_14_0_20_42_7]
MKIAVTGISGFVGPHLRRELESHGHEVIGVDRNAKETKTRACDLTNSATVYETILSEKPNAIIHLAALTSVKDSWDNPKKYLEVNTSMTRNLLDAINKTEKKTKILITSTSDVYGNQNQFPIKELATPHPENPYATSKLAQEQLVDNFIDIHAVISRSFNHTGPGASDALVVGTFAKQIVACEKGIQKEIKVGNLGVSRDFLDVRDVAQAYRLLIERGKTHEIYNICSGKPTKISWILDFLLSQSTAKIEVRQDPDRMRPSDVQQFWGSFEKIKSETGWSPKIPFEQTLIDTLEYWRTRE